MKRLLYTVPGIIFIFCFAGCRKNLPVTNNGGGNTVADVPSGSKDGVNFLNAGKSVIFNLYAPGKKSVAVTGEFNNWQPLPLKNSSDGKRWWIQIDELDPSKEYAYQYLVDGSIKISDPYTEKILDPANDQYIDGTIYPGLKPYPTGATTGIVSTFWYNEPAYNWQAIGFQRPLPKNLVIYEMLVRDFVSTHSYNTIRDTLGYLQRLGVNAIELMPINEFEGNDSWGYNPNFYFAPDKYYGTKNDLKALIDACHSRGMAVIQDVVLNHSFGSSPMVQLYWNGVAPGSENPWYNTIPTHPFNVGFQFNHESADTKYFVKNVLKWWMTEYHLDGFRFDLAKGFTQKNSGDDVGLWGQYDASRVAIWKEYNRFIRAIDPDFYVILEHFGANQEEAELAAEGMMSWSNLSSAGQQATMGYNDAGGSWDLSGLFYDGYGFSNPYGLVTYFESHDEERLQFKNGMYGNAAGSYTIKDLLTGLKRDEMGAVFLFASPGPKMIWQFGERGYDVSIDAAGGRLSDKPPRWEYMAEPGRAHLFDVYAKMANFKKHNPVFTTTNFKYNLAQAVKTIELTGSDGTIVEVIGNFGVTGSSINFPVPGTWTDNIDGSAITVPSLPFTMVLAAGEYHLYSNKPLTP